MLEGISKEYFREVMGISQEFLVTQVFPITVPQAQAIQ
jgi:hypothetical protein